jgi:hypothetical protein
VVTPTRTEGEVLFEKYLGLQGISFDFEREYAGKSKRPDYTINWNGKTCLFDVKDFERSDHPLEAGPVPEIYPLIREKIDRARDKFREYKGGDFCCAVALYNRGNPRVLLKSPDIVLGAMYGDVSWDFRNPVTGERDFAQTRNMFGGGGKMIRPTWKQPQNTTLSAIITLTTVRPAYSPKRLVFDQSNWVRLRPGSPKPQGDAKAHEPAAVVSSGTSGHDNPAEPDLFLNEPDYDDPEATIPRVIFWHNIVARTPFPRDLFCGPYDVHFGRVMTNAVTFRGGNLVRAVEVTEITRAPKPR